MCTPFLICMDGCVSATDPWWAVPVSGRVGAAGTALTNLVSSGAATDVTGSAAVNAMALGGAIL